MRAYNQQGHLGVMERAKRNKGNLRSGFTLTELLVAMAITGVVMAAVFKIYTTQQDSYVLQEQVAEMQQNGRTAKYVMTREIRMLGYDPTGLAGAGFISAGGNIIHFTMDITDEDGTITVPGDDITYSVSADKELMRNDGANNQPVVENVEAVGFAYAFDADDDGSIDTSAGGNIMWAIDSDVTDADSRLDKYLDTNDDGIISIDDDAAGADLATPVPLDKIRAVRMWILARTGREDKAFADTTTYVVADQRVNANDGSRHHLLTTTVKCRNMAL
jgi:type IV pilus assembly protein PilW